MSDTKQKPKTFQALLDAGVIPGSDMTPEAALMKLAYVLGQEDCSHDVRVKVGMLAADSHSMR